MTHFFLVFPHQLFSELADIDSSTHIVFIEDDLFFRQFKFHKQKLLLHRASMQALYDELSASHQTSYISSDAKHASMDQLADMLATYESIELHHYDLVDDWLEQRLHALAKAHSYTVKRLPSPAFLTSRGQVEDYFDQHPNRMQSFYIWQRKRLNILVENDKPVGGKWSFDAANRKKLPKGTSVPDSYYSYDHPAIDEAKPSIVDEFSDNYGSLDSFRYPVTHEDAERWLKHFIDDRLATFGPYEDAIHSEHRELYHSLLSPLLNIGLLTPEQVLKAVLNYASTHEVPIESLEGFVRQLIGWREYMRATYVTHGREMRMSNHLDATSKLPDTFWTGKTGLDPIDETISRVLETGYAHHIERLMLLGNVMTLLGIQPDDVYEWFMTLFIDAYDWVMVPNVYAMSQFAAGDFITTKPYVSGSNYVHKMSDYKKADWSTVWDGLYWAFVDKHRELFEQNNRTAMVVKLYDKMGDERKKDLQAAVTTWRDSLS